MQRDVRFQQDTDTRNPHGRLQIVAMIGQQGQFGWCDNLQHGLNELLRIQQKAW